MILEGLAVDDEFELVFGKTVSKPVMATITAAMPERTPGSVVHHDGLSLGTVLAPSIDTATWIIVAKVCCVIIAVVSNRVKSFQYGTSLLTTTRPLELKAAMWNDAKS